MQPGRSAAESADGATMEHMEITTKRLLLREYESADLDAVHAFASDPAVCSMVEWGPNTVAQSAEFLAACAAEAAAEPRETLTLAITLDGEVIGSIALMRGVSEGLSTGTSDGVPDLLPGRETAELGYVLRADSWGRGYTTEAAAAMLEFAARQWGTRRVVATCRPENFGSIRVLEKSGLRRIALLPGHTMIDGVARDSLLFALELQERFTPGPARRPM